MSEFKRGTEIVVRAFGDSPLVRRLWDWDENGVFVHDNEQYSLRRSGGEFLEPVGFRWSDAYVKPEGLEAVDIEAASLDWQTLTPLSYALPGVVATRAAA